MNIAFTNIYGSVYERDGLFDEKQCKIGENLLLPLITLKRELVKAGHTVHTIDMYPDIKAIDIFVFQDVPASIITPINYKDYIKLSLKRLKKNDMFYSIVKQTKKEQRILIIAEPEVVNPRSYIVKYHKYFGKIATWNTSLINEYGYSQYCYPQPVPSKSYIKDYKQKKFCTIICGNKTSAEKNELYSDRRKIIDYLENSTYEFDLYGFGWEKEGLKNYKGTTAHKLETLSNYKYCICYENMCNTHGYITEKIFDCFFSGTIPIYWGADDIEDYIPASCYIDRRAFDTDASLLDYINQIQESEYNSYINSAKKYLKSDKFNNTFSVNAYIANMKKLILDY